MAQERVNGPSVGVPLSLRARIRAAIDPRQVGWTRPLLTFVPAAIVARLAGASAGWQFLLAGLGIIPLAGLMGEATEQLARKIGPVAGGLLNASFGNAAELIIALFLLFRGQDQMVKASLTGSIIGNLLLVLGASVLAGGLRFSIQRFNRRAASVGSTMMTLAAIGLLIPAIFHNLPGIDKDDVTLEHELSVGVSLILILTYGLSLLFSLHTHKDLFAQECQDGEDLHGGPVWTLRKAVLVLVAATAFVGWLSEILSGVVEATSHAWGLTQTFVGVIVVAIVGNAAEHSTAILVAMKNQMDLAVGIAVGSALQIALFVAPVLVFASYLRPHPMDLLFTTLEVLAVILAVVIARMVAEDGESNWLEGVMLLMIYAILGVTFFLYPEPEPHPAGSAATPAAGPAAPAAH